MDGTRDFSNDVSGGLLLATKLHIPFARPTVPRPRLIQRLDQALESRLTLVSASAGFGKTTLLAEWARHSRLPVAWLSLDEGDNAPARFWAYFFAALRTIGLDAEGVLPSLLNSQPPLPVEAFLTATINWMARQPGGFALVLDDYNVVSMPDVHTGLTFLLDHLPPQVHLVVATRIDPPLPLARLRARRELAELHSADLRFTLDETATFLQDVMGLDLSKDDVAALAVHTEGWIAGLQLAALSMQGRENLPGFVAALTGSQRDIMDYLAEEVLYRQPQDVQRFLLQTSILDRLTGPLCDAVTGQPGGQAMLERLETANLFIVPLDDQRQWYRYHQLFAKLLRYLLSQSQPEYVPVLNRRAAEWHEQAGLVGEAVTYALAAADFEWAARLVEQNALRILTHGRMAALAGWLGALPGEVVRSRPRLYLYHAWALIASGFQFDAAEMCLRQAEQVVHSPVDRPAGLSAGEAGAVLGGVATIRAYYLRLQGDIARAVVLTRQALDLVPEEDVVLRTLAMWSLGEAYRYAGDVPAWSRTVEQMNVLGQASRKLGLALIVLDNLAELQVMQGQLHQAADTWRGALKLARERWTRRFPMVSLLHMGLGGVLAEWNELDAASRYLVEGVEMARQAGMTQALLDGSITLARVKHAQGDLDGALAALRDVEPIADRHPATGHSPRVLAYRARLWLAQGNLTAVTGWLRTRGLSADDKPGFSREFEHLVLVRVLISQGKPGEALQLLRRLQQAAEAAGRVHSLVEILVLQALAFYVQGKTTRAMIVLERVAALAEPGGYTRVFVDEGPRMAGLLAHAAACGLASGTVHRLLAAFPEGPFPSPPAVQPLAEPLSARELDVLQLLATHLSGREIAQELGISPNTARTHIKNIYGKLNAHDRGEAVERARALELLARRTRG